ncbi:hypothetical protein CRYUN_Cryun36dG0017300 [Craigia yunnanensis]
MGIFSSEFSVPHGNGYRFYPTKKELFSLYLRPAVNGEPFPSNALIEVEIYGENKEPWNIFDKNANNSFWVLTKLKKKGKSKIDRTAGSGSWIARSISKKVMDAHGEVLGLRKYFCFKSKEDHEQWIMHEFSLNEAGLNDYVICKIKNKDAVEPKNKKHASPEANDDEEMSLESTAKKDYVEIDLNQPNIEEWNGSGGLTIDQQKLGNLDDQGNHDLIENKDADADAVEAENKKRKTDEEMSLIPTVKKDCIEIDVNQANIEERNGSRVETTNQQKLGNLDDRENHDITLLQTPAPISTINPTNDSLEPDVGST